MGRSGVVVVGSLHFDVMVATPYLPQKGETLMGEAWWWKPGGKGGNQAMAAARHGAATSMVACLGDDLMGVQLRERLAAAGVDLDHVSTQVQGSGMSVALQESDGDYAAVVVSGANRALQPVHVEAAAADIDQAAVLLLQNEIAEGTNRAAAHLGRDAGATVVLNAAPARALGAMEGLIDILVLNGIEAQQLGAGEVTDLESAQRAVAALRALSPVVVVTAGAAGTAVSADDGPLAVEGHPVEDPETHGAGDVFTGALAARLASGSPLQDAVRYANGAAALHVGTPATERDAIGPTDVRALLATELDG